MNLPPNRIERVSIADEAVKRLREIICSGRIAVGEKLPTEGELQLSLGVGRSTVREALRMLQAMGLVEMKSGRGAFVRQTSVVSLEDWVVENEELLVNMMEVRTTVEMLAARLAAARGTAEQFERIRLAHGDFIVACENGDGFTLVSIDKEFHNAIFEASNNVFLTRMSEIFTEPLRAYRQQCFANEKLRAQAAEPHKRILDAILARDPVRAAAAMRSHLAMSLRDIEQIGAFPAANRAAGRQ